MRDRGSTNGTRLNGIAIQTTHPLRDGDVIGIGRTELRIAL
ncbi:FHA domain-containing protein [uncultured Lamprocystis sp.]|nr:FHA domain-containing protein [uncultured Lamprocystis sp.]